MKRVERDRRAVEEKVLPDRAVKAAKVEWADRKVVTCSWLLTIAAKKDLYVAAKARRKDFFISKIKNFKYEKA